jgi:sucrose synthase
LRGLVNLVVVGGVNDPEDTGDREERDECVKMHRMIRDYKLQVGGGSRGGECAPH